MSRIGFCVGFALIALGVAPAAADTLDPGTPRSAHQAAKPCAADPTSTYQVGRLVHLATGFKNVLDSGRGFAVITDQAVKSLPLGLSMQAVINTLGMPDGFSYNTGSRLVAYLWFVRAGNHPLPNGGSENAWGFTFVSNTLRQKFISNN
jgi:hypothetical protein